MKIEDINFELIAKDIEVAVSKQGRLEFVDLTKILWNNGICLAMMSEVIAVLRELDVLIDDFSHIRAGDPLIIHQGDF